MQNYFNLEDEKRKALMRLFYKYGFIFGSVLFSLFFTISDIFDIFGFLEKVEMFEKPESFGFGVIVSTFIFSIFTIIIVNQFWEFFYLFKKDYNLVAALLREEFKIQTAIVDFVQSNDASISMGGKKKVVLKRYKIYFEDFNKTYNDSRYTDLKKGDKVYLWLSTNPDKYQRILHITKIN